jgi:hypothetical protein
MKQYLHLIAPLTLWIIGLILYLVTMNNAIPKQIDSVKTYQVQKKPHSFLDAWYNVKDAFSTYWPDDTCYSDTGMSATGACGVKRATLVTQVKAAMECNKYSSQSCNCITEVMKGVVGTTTNSTWLVGKNLAGKKDSTMFAIESCRWIMHNPHVTISSGKIWAQRTAILLLILTLVTGNGADWVLTDKFVATLQDSMSKAMIKILTIFFWGMLALGITVTAENNTYFLFLLILLPPVVLLALYEVYLPAYDFDHRPFIHPYVFATVLGALSLLAHAEVGVADFDIIVFEILKCNVASYLYLQLVWKYMIASTHNNEADFAKSNYVETGTLRSVCLVVGIYLVGLWAPYTTSCVDNFMWYTPFIWTVLATASVVWVCSFEYNSMFGQNVKNLKENKKGEYLLTEAFGHVSALVLVFMFLVLLYYLRENAFVYRVLIDRFPTQSIQYNMTQTWMRPPVILTSVA